MTIECCEGFYNMCKSFKSLFVFKAERFSWLKKDLIFIFIFTIFFKDLPITKIRNVLFKILYSATLSISPSASTQIHLNYVADKLIGFQVKTAAILTIVTWPSIFIISITFYRISIISTEINLNFIFLRGN